MGDGPNCSGSSRRWLTLAVEASLRRLQTDWIYLYQVHRPDPETDIEETLSVLNDLVHAGKIRAFGCSTYPADHIVHAAHVAERNGWLRFRTVQPPTLCWPVGSRKPSCRRVNGSEWACSPGARSPRLPQRQAAPR